MVDVNMQFLLELGNLTKLKILLDVGNDRISFANLNWEMPVIRKYGHLYIEWPKCVIFTVRELRKVHLYLFHSQPDCIYLLLRRSNPNKTTTDDLKNSETITRKCDEYQRLPSAQSRFRIALLSTDCVFNRCICINLMELRSRTVLHAVNQDTKISSSHLFPN